MTPRPNWATRPVTVRSVVTVTLVPSPSATRRAVIVALALPWPRVSRPSARSTALPPASSRSTKVALPLYWAVMGPTFTLTMPRYSSPSISCSSAPGMHGAMRSTSVSRAQASCLGTGTRNSLVNSMSLRSLLVNGVGSGVCGGLSPPGQIGGRVDVGRVSDAGYFADEVGPPPDQRAGALVTIRGQEGPHLAGKSDGVAAVTAVGRHRNGRPGGCHRLPRFDRDRRLVAQTHDHGAVAGRLGRLDAGVQRRGLAVGPAGVGDDPHRGRHEVGDLRRAGDDEGLVQAGRDGVVDGPQHERAAPKRSEELMRRTGKSAACTGSQNDGRGRQRFNGPPGAPTPGSSRAWGPRPHARPFGPGLGVCLWMAPSLSRRLGAWRPVRRAMISPHMETAVSSGVRAPMSRPMGAITRASSSSVTPASRNRSSRWA